MVIKPLGVQERREERDGYQGQGHWLPSLPCGPSFSETSDGMVDMDTMVCYLECEPRSGTTLLEVLFTALRCCFKRDYSPSLQIIPTIPHSQGYHHCPNINRPSPSAYISAYTSNREGSRSHLFRKRGQGDGQANSSPGTEPRGKHLHEKGCIWLWRELL